MSSVRASEMEIQPCRFDFGTWDEGEERVKKVRGEFLGESVKL